MAVQVELMRVDVETVSELSAGQTVCDVWHQSSKPKNVRVAQVAHSHLNLTVKSFALPALELRTVRWVTSHSSKTASNHHACHTAVA